MLTTTTAGSSLSQDLRSLVSFLLCLVVLYGFGVVDEVIRRLLARSLSEALETEVRVGFLSVWLVSGRVDLDKASVATWRGRGFETKVKVIDPSKEKDTKSVGINKALLTQEEKKALEKDSNHDTIQVGGIQVWCDTGRALWTRIVRIEKMRIARLKLRLIRRKDGTLNVEFFARKKRMNDTFFAGTADFDQSRSSVDDDWIDVSRVSTKDRPRPSNEIAPNRKRAQALWSLVTTAAADAEQRLRTRRDDPGKSMFEDAALLALDAAQVAKAEVDRSAEQAKRWAKDTARQGLEDALKSFFDRAELTPPVDPNAPLSPQPPKKTSFIKMLFEEEAKVYVDSFVLELADAKGIELIETPIVFEERILDAFSINPDRKPLEPGRALVRLSRLLIQACLEDLIESRPNDATRLAKAVASNLTFSAKRAAETKVASIAKSFGVDRGLFQQTPTMAFDSFTDRPDDDDYDDDNLNVHLLPDDLLSTTF